MSRIPLLATGLNGLVGSKFVTDFSTQYDFQNLDISDPTNPIDITDVVQVRDVVHASPAEFMIHLAAFTDVTKAWEQKGDKEGLAYRVNVNGTKNIIEACEFDHKHLIHISTAFVFDGQKDSLYTEEDEMRPIEWYGQTKAEADEAVMNANCPWTVLRIDFPFRSDSFPKPDIVRKTVSAMGKGVPLFTNHFFGPTFIDDLTQVIDWVIRTKSTGIFHASSGEKWSDYQLGELLNNHFQLGYTLKKGDLDEYLKTLDRPYQKNTALDCSKLISRLDFELTPIKEAVKQVQL